MTESKSEIHDLGYAAYTGPRTPPSRRFLVIARNVFAVAWRSRWGVVKVPIIAAVGTTITAAVVMYFLRLSLTEMVRQRGAPIPKADAIVFMAGVFYEFSAFILAAVVGCAAIADDLRMGAFQFYFARALRPRDYVAGKLLGLAMLIGLPMLCGPVVLALMRLVYADSVAQALELLPLVLQALAQGTLGTLAYVLPAAGIGAWARKRGPAQALYAVYYLLIAPAAYGLSVPLHLPLLRTLSLPNDLTVLGEHIFGLPKGVGEPPGLASAISLAAFCAAGFAAIWIRVRRAETAGMGNG